VLTLEPKLRRSKRFDLARSFAAVPLALLAFRLGAQGQPPRDTVARVPAYRARLLGLFDQATGEPIEGADVFDVSSGWSAKTTATGTVSLVFLPEGGGLVRIRKVGYAPVFTKIAISPRDTAPLTLLLERVAELPAVVTRDSAHRFIAGPLNAFEERARLKLTGYFITDTLLRKSENRTLGNLIRSQLPNALLKDGAFGSTYLMSGRTCVGGAYPEVFLDGVPMNTDGVSGSKNAIHIPPQPFNLNEIQVSALQGVEWYPSGGSVPAEFTSERTGCGALMLWTRER
jgi:hypothetical protein